MFTKKQRKALVSIFSSHQDVKLAYFFGSRSKGAGGKLSDYDFAVYLDCADQKGMTDIKLMLMDKISRLLKTDKVDVVILNTAKIPELKYSIIKEGELIYETGGYKVLAEPRIMNEYFDFRAMLLRYNLSKS